MSAGWYAAECKEMQSAPSTVNIYYTPCIIPGRSIKEAPASQSNYTIPFPH